MSPLNKLLNLWKLENSPSLTEDKAYSNELVDKIASVFSPGGFFYCIYNFFEMDFDYVHPNVKNVLGIDPQEFTLNRYLECFDKEDLGLLRQKEALVSEFLSKEIPPEKIPFYKISYSVRIKDYQDNYKQLLYQGTTLSVTEDNKRANLVGVHLEMPHLDLVQEDKVSFIGLGGEPSWYNVDPENPVFTRENFDEVFSKRELNVLRKISEGKNNNEIAEDLHLSVETIKTHRKNIMKKTRCRNLTELLAKCIRDGLI